MKGHLKNTWLYYLGGLAIFGIILLESRGTGDFDIFLSASQDMMQGENIYENKYREWYHYYYDTLFALILYPLTYLPVYFVKIIWLLANVFFVYRLWRIIQSWLPLDQFSKRARQIFSFLSFVFILSFLRDNFHLGQVTILILYLTLEGISYIQRGKVWWGSALLALGINIKIMPIVFIPYLLYRAQWKPALLIIGFMFFFLIIPSVFIGYDYNQSLLVERWELINPSNKEHLLDTSERSFHSLTTLLATLFVKDCGDYHALTIRRHIADISIENLQLIINGVRLFFIAFTLWFLRTRPFKRETNNVQFLYEISYLCMVIPLIFPHQQHYAFFFIFPATCYLLYFAGHVYFMDEDYRTTKKFKLKKVTFLAALGIAYFLTNSRFVLGTFRHYYDHYKTLTYGVLLLIILLAICRPSKLVGTHHKESTQTN